MEETITTYVSSDGKEVLIVEMNPTHLVNALLKLTKNFGENPEMQEALKGEVMKRLTEEKQS